MKGFGKKRRCRKGMSCGETCISRKKECVLDLPKPVAKSTTRFRDKVKDVIGKVKSGVSNIFGRRDKMMSGAPQPQPLPQPPIRRPEPTKPQPPTSPETTPPSTKPPGKKKKGEDKGLQPQPQPQPRPQPPTPPSKPPTPPTPKKETEKEKFTRNVRALSAALNKSVPGTENNKPAISKTDILRNKYSEERERLVRLHNTAEKMQSKIQNSNLDDKDKAVMSKYLEKVKDEAKSKIRNAINMELVSSREGLKDYIKVATKIGDNAAVEALTKQIQSKSFQDLQRDLLKSRMDGSLDNDFHRHRMGMTSTPPRKIEGLADSMKWAPKPTDSGAPSTKSPKPPGQPTPPPPPSGAGAGSPPKPPKPPGAPPGGAPPPPPPPPSGGPTPPPGGGPQPRAKERPENRFERAVKVLEGISGGTSLGGGARTPDINYKGISEFKNKYTDEREKLVKAVRTADRLKSKIENSNIPDGEKTRLLNDLDRISKNSRTNLIDAIRLENESWVKTVQQYQNDPAISNRDKKNLARSLRANEGDIKSLFEARMQGVSDREYRAYRKAVAEAMANNTPQPKPPSGIPGLAEEARRATGAKPPPGAPPPVPPGDLPRRPGGGGYGRTGRGGGYGGYGGYGGGRPYQKVEEGVASFVRKIVEAISKLLSKISGAGGGGDTSVIEKNARRLANRLPKEQRDKLLKYLDRKFPKKVKVEDKGPKDGADLAQATQKIMDKYNKSLRSSSSLIRRSSTLLNELHSRLERTPDSDVATRNRLIRSYDRAYDRYQQARSKMDSIMNGVRSEMMKTSLSRDEVNGLLRSVKFDIKDRAGAGQTRAQMREFIRMFNGGGFTTVQGEGKGGVGKSLNNVTIKGGPDRAHAEVTNGKVTLKPGSGLGSKATNFHELAHIIEGQRPWLRSMLEEWRDSRAFSRDEIAQFIKDSKGRPMSAAGYAVGANGEQVPIIRLNRFNPLYGKEEVAVADSFVNPYMGKIYRHGRGTEVLSMAVEHFADPSKMTDLYVSHPELFNLVVGLSAS